jgi:hypothetical protein
MENMLKEQEHHGRFEVDKTGAQHLSSELLPRIAVSRTPKAKPPRPATPVKKSGERHRRGSAALTAATSMSIASEPGSPMSSGSGRGMLPPISSQIPSTVEYVYEDT